ncbi:hypothetical protein Tco_0277742, partial [Tanacetum coccineum]
MKTKGFWDAVIKYFENETGSSRGYDSIVSKWKNKVRPRIGAFCAIINNVEENHKSASGGFNLNKEVDEAVEETQEPMGRDRAKAKKKAAGFSRGGSPLFVVLLSIREAEAREAAQLKREKLEIQRRTLELAEREKWDRDILFYNSIIDPCLAPIQQEKLLEMKMEIKERYNLDYYFMLSE